MSQDPPPATDPAAPPPPPPPGADPTSHPQAWPTATPRKSSGGVAVIVVLVLIILAAGIWHFKGAIGGGASGPETAASAFFKKNGDSGPDAAYATTSAAFQDATPAATWSTLSQRLQLASYTEASWSDAQVSGDVASLHGTVKRLNLPDLKAAVDLRRIDGTWKVASVSVQDPTISSPAPSANGGANPTTTAQQQQQPPATAPGDPSSMAPSDNAGGAMAGTAPTTLPPPTPIAPVPRYGGAPMSTPTGNLALGRAGPPGTAMPSGQVGPECMSPLWKMGFRADSVRCPLYLPTIPGRQETCMAHSIDGRVGTVTVTFLDYDPITKRGTFDCHLN